MAYAEKRVSTAKGSKGKVSWRARYLRPDGKWGSEPGFPTKKTAENWGDAQEAAIREGRWVDPALSATKFGVFAREWMAVQRPRGRTTINRWERLDYHLLPKWEHTPLLAFNWFEVEAWARTLPCARSTTKDSVQLLTRILNGAVDKRYLAVNPLAGRRLTGLPADPAPKKSEEEQWAPTEVVLQLARRLGPVYGLHVLATAFLGLRWEELVGLRRDNALLERRQRHEGGVFACPIIRVDKEGGVLAEYYVRDEAGKRKSYRALEPPKNEKSARDIDVPPFLRVLLEKHLADWPYEWVFCTHSGKWWWRSAWFKVIRPAADGRDARPEARGPAVKEEWEPIMPGLTMRALRHTHDTWQAEDNVNPVLAHEQSGHKYPGIKGTYQHPTPAMRKQRLEALERRYERGMKTLGWQGIWEES